jgi:O-antigen ligase/polysaccharide polymerase Wzy-like membrane protein
MPLHYMVATAVSFAVFILVFIRPEAGLYMVLFSMLLSPEFGAGASQKLAEGRSVVIRLEDVLLVVIAFSWLAKMAVNKDLGVAVKNRLNGPIVAYVTVTLLATIVGYLSGTVRTRAGWFYVLKYVEYFVVFYMTVNNLRDRDQAWRLMMTAFFTAAVVSLIGIAQIPSGQRVSAPFEGDAGEPNTFGGYLLLMMAILGGLALETQYARVRVWALGLVGLMFVPFMFTLSRASYLGVIPTMLTLAAFSRRRRVMIGLLIIGAALSPLLLSNLMPASVKERIAYTFKTQSDQPTVRVGRIGFDPSTSERLNSMRDALVGWIHRPVLGYGVTGFRFMDAQYFRTLIETGIVGLACFLWLVVTVLRSAGDALALLRDPDDRGIAVGFLAGTVGILVHAIGSNTFIIIRVMEPFWFFMAIVIALPLLEQVQPAPTPTPQPVRSFVRYST